MSVVANTVNISRVSVHCVKNIPIGAQLSFQSFPHWNNVAKKNAKLHALTMPIITQLDILNARTWPNIRRHRKSMLNFMIPKPIFSVVWKPYLY